MWFGSDYVYLFFAATQQARPRLADAVIAVERFRRRHGDLPQKLEDIDRDLLPEIPVDPYSGKPVRYRINPDGHVVYSVGNNRVDDGGEGRSDRDPDMGFTITLRK